MKTILIVVLFAVGSLSAFCSNIAVEIYGKGPAIIIIPGLGGTLPWKDVIGALSLHQTCYVISVKGLNGDKSPADPDFNSVEKEISDFMDREKIVKPVLIAHSLGGFIAMHLAESNGSAFKKLILVDAYPFSPGIYNPAFNADMGLQQAAILRKQMSGMSDQNYAALWKQNVRELITDSSYHEIVLDNILSSERKSIVEAQAFVLSNDLRPDMNNIKCPVMALCSSYMFGKAGLSADVIRNRMEEQFHNLADCSIFINDQSRHFIILDAPGWLMEKINDSL